MLHSTSPFRYPLARPQDALREAITRATRVPEADAVRALLPEATLTEAQRGRAQALARELAAKVRDERRDATGADALMHAFALSSDEGIALMCLAEALLRIPDTATADALIRDKISHGDWRAHAGSSDSMFVNAACWALLVTGKLVAEAPDAGTLSRALSGALARVGEPAVRAAMRAAMRFLGEQFVLAETVEDALERARLREAEGYRYSYDMLGEAALTAEDALRYHEAYAAAMHAIGRSAHRRGVVEGPGLSVKLSALHPRYARAQHARVMRELLPRLESLAMLAMRYDVGLAIDAEESDRLDLSLDVFEALARKPALASWTGLGLVVQSYLKRAPQVVDWTLALARETQRRFMVRLVKGAYWDGEIKRAQVGGHADYPVFTRKAHTDIAYLACARRLLDRRDLVYPQFATHNAATLAALLELAGDREGFEFQCLHGMGESLYDHLVGPQTPRLPCRIYAPIGTHETLLAYLVRRLLENGANTSFVNQVVDARIDLDRLTQDPVTTAAPFGGTPHPRLPLPSALHPGRANSRGIDLADELALGELQTALDREAAKVWVAQPKVAGRSGGEESLARAVRAPADATRVVGHVVEATREDVEAAMASAAGEGASWQRVPPAERASILERAADLIEERRATFIHLAVREAGKTIPNAIGEVREAVDFCRYYAQQIRDRAPAAALGPVAAISPWNFPLAIFTGQVAGALAAGNAVVAKPAEQTPLIAREAVRALHDAGVPRAALQFLPGTGESVGALLVADPRTAGVVFTGSTAVATLIHRTLAARGNVPLVAETGGQNAMIVDASALPEQVVQDAIASAFDSAGQRCSALRVLCLQHEIADRMIGMLSGAMRELVVGDPADLATDVGPIIDAAAKEALTAHVVGLERQAKRIARAPLDTATAARGHFLAPAAFEIPTLSMLKGEVFGPVLHVLRYRAGEEDALVDALNDLGYALTLGVHSRIDATVRRIAGRTRAGNVYVNRNMIGAVVGVQPFGGEGLSGTGPKAGGPLYVPRLTRDPGDVPRIVSTTPGSTDGPPESPGPAGETRNGAVELPGPTGETNTWRVEPRGRLLAIGGADHGEAIWRAQAEAALRSGNRVLFAPNAAGFVAARLVASAQGRAARIDVLPPGSDWSALPDIDGVLAADSETAAEANRKLAARDGARLPVIEPAGDPPRYPPARLVVERVVSVNTTAAGGNASLVAAMD
jgi:RHH-type proline utilization regulon transcriptional repressor/proline dehydrogenase/delta 1-pyrroline-5-carboxylate dehydrogenase